MKERAKSRPPPNPSYLWKDGELAACCPESYSQAYDIIWSVSIRQHIFFCKFEKRKPSCRRSQKAKGRAASSVVAPGKVCWVPCSFQEQPLEAACLWCTMRSFFPRIWDREYHCEHLYLVAALVSPTWEGNVLLGSERSLFSLVWATARTNWVKTL